MIAVSNASPIIIFSAVSHLWVLEALYGRVLIPRAVHDEVALDPGGRAGAAEVVAAKWIEIRDVQNLDAVEALTAAALGVASRRRSHWRGRPAWRLSFSMIFAHARWRNVIRSRLPA